MTPTPDGLITPAEHQQEITNRDIWHALENIQKDVATIKANQKTEKEECVRHRTSITEAISTNATAIEYFKYAAIFFFAIEYGPKIPPFILKLVMQ